MAPLDGAHLDMIAQTQTPAARGADATAKEVTRDGEWTRVEYARYADDLVILVDGYRRHA